MKPLRALSLLLLFICFSEHEASGQMYQALGYSRSQVITQMRQVKELNDEKEDLSSNGTPTLSYFDKSSNFMHVFFFAKDKCVVYRLGGSVNKSTELLTILRKDGFFFDDSIRRNLDKHRRQSLCCLQKNKYKLLCRILQPSRA